jgi:hypothetical protein
MSAYFLAFVLGLWPEASLVFKRPIEKVKSLVSDPLQNKEVAKAKLQAAHVSTRELLLAKLDAARQEYEARQKESLVGTGTLDILLGASLRLLESERAVWNSPSEQLACIQRYWERTKQCEHLMKERMEAGRIPVKEYYELKYRRLLAETWLTEFKAKGVQPALQAWKSPLAGGALETKEPDWVAEIRALGGQLASQACRAPLAYGALETKELARTEFTSSRTSLQKVNEDRVYTAYVVYFSRSREFLAGRGTLDLLLGCSLRLLEAEQTLAPTKRERLTALEGYWARTRLIEQVNFTRYQWGRIPIQDYLHSKYFLLEADMRMAQLKEKKDLPVDFIHGPRGPYDAAWPPDLEPKELAKAALAALHADPKALAREKLQAARGHTDARFKDFLAGRGTLDILLEALVLQNESELALALSQSDRVAAYEQHWERLIQVDIVQKQRYDRQRIPIQDYMESRYFGLQAQIWLAEARAKQSQ